MRARQARHIRRRSQQSSQCPNHFGTSELWLAKPAHARVILRTPDTRLKCWLLGFTELPAALLAKFQAQGQTWCA